MGAVFDEFTRDLARRRERCQGQPRRELTELFLLALEREEIVSVGYRESLMEQRLEAMPLPADIRELIRHALVWIWKDEEMHTIYIRGAILKLGGWWLRTQALVTQVAGALGGWAGSVLQHSPWRRAPVSRLLSHLLTFAGRLTGKVPADVRRHLQFGPFRGFCAFNVDAERTAAACWNRISELAESLPDRDPTLCRDFQHVAHDEDRHAALFQLFHDSLTDDDTLVEGVTRELLVERIRAIGEEFLPHADRSRSPLENPIGSNSAVHVFESERLDEQRTLFRRCLVESRLAEALAARAAYLEKPVESLRVAIKPTFMLSYSRRDPSPMTNPALVGDLVDYLRELGCRDVALIEGRNIYDRFYANRSVADVARYCDMPLEGVALSDAELEQQPHCYQRGLAQYSIARTWRDADFRISFAKLRSHPIEMALLCLGNVEWVGARCDQYLFLERQADRTTAIMMLLDEFPPHFGLLDGFDQVPDGLVGVMGCRRPKRIGRFYAGRDVLALDRVALRHLGVGHSQRGSLIRAAEHWFGGVSSGHEVVGVDEPIAEWRGPYANEIRSLLSLFAYPVYVLGSGRGELFVPEIDTNAFPPLVRERWTLRVARSGIRLLLGLRLRPEKQVA